MLSTVDASEKFTTNIYDSERVRACNHTFLTEDEKLTGKLFWAGQNRDGSAGHR